MDDPDGGIGELGKGGGTRSGRGIGCGPATCDPDTQVCCLFDKPQCRTDVGPDTCHVAGDPEWARQLSCDDAADCHDGEVCCGEADFGWLQRWVACDRDCSWSALDGYAVQICDPSVDGECRRGACMSAEDLEGYAECQ